ncbi:hypothetical protein [Ferrimonas sp. SCSIO 43195]|uniref:hypothetical protein n=1 Tax=Ferrimonas sp. SCSIO 43195 TaxID=2822844 RepID=UPI002074D8E0|nr:hypothetical protein [Ferrimonas sp. SCSIO 43195]USD36185.1 hypothetical protein J8Z22_14210 [Ferrimonas sp. SCSIO 43195]
MKYFIVALCSLIASGCSAESEFIQTDCGYLNEDYLIVSFASNSASRTVSIGNSALTFKGTTLEDMKWLAEFTDIESVAFEKEVLLKITLHSGFSKNIGRVNANCKALIDSHFKERNIVW